MRFNCSLKCSLKGRLLLQNSLNTRDIRELALPREPGWPSMSPASIIGQLGTLGLNVALGKIL